MNCIFAIILNHILPFISKLVESSQIKLSRFWTQAVFHKYFHQTCLEFFLSFGAVCREQKRWKSLGKISGEYGWWGLNILVKSNIFPAWFLLNVALHVVIHYSTTFFLLKNARNFLRFLCTLCSYWKYKSSLRVRRGLKTLNNAAVITLYTQHNFSSLKLHLWGRLKRFILVRSLLCAMNIELKVPSYHMYWYPWETGHLSALNTFHIGNAIVLVLLSKYMSTPKA